APPPMAGMTWSCRKALWAAMNSSISARYVSIGSGASVDMAPRPLARRPRGRQGENACRAPLVDEAARRYARDGRTVGGGRCDDVELLTLPARAAGSRRRSCL